MQKPPTPADIIAYRVMRMLILIVLGTLLGAAFADVFAAIIGALLGLLTHVLLGPVRSH